MGLIWRHYAQFSGFFRSPLRAYWAETHSLEKHRTAVFYVSLCLILRQKCTASFFIRRTALQ